MRAILILAFSTLTAPLVLADSHGDCDSKGGGGGIIDTGAGFYVDDRNFVLGNGIWVYEESNGLAGLQRGGSSPYVPDDTEICTDDSTNGPDTLIF